ncbi:nucleotide exchange factor GrpE [Candidatus Woesearchaeota archaeon]|nr:nucleotide exchange factor GrpE [Candidatus Woesearchaeota archaeon]
MAEKKRTENSKDGADKAKKRQKKEEQIISEKNKKIRELNRKVEELTDTLQRLQAEVDNYRKRCERENQEFRNYASAKVVENMLPILDNFMLALRNTQDYKQFVKGMEMIYSQIYDILEKEGMRPIKTEGEKFDPYKHEILMTEKTDKEEEDEMIKEELQRGYMFKDKVLRYAKVKVLKKA